MRAGNVDIVDDTFVRASPAAVRAALDAVGLPADDPDRWPVEVRLAATEDRGTKGVRWAASGRITGRMEIWLEAGHGGTIVHHFVHGQQVGGPRRWTQAHRRRWKHGLNEIKDRLEGRSR